MIALFCRKYWEKMKVYFDKQPQFCGQNIYQEGLTYNKVFILLEKF